MSKPSQLELLRFSLAFLDGIIKLYDIFAVEDIV
jgi:hypothetical protein